MNLIEKWDLNFKKVLDKDSQAQKGNALVGRYIKEPFADGYAFYEIVKENKNTVRIKVITGIGDDDKLREVGIQRIIKQYEDTGRKAKHTSDNKFDGWAEFEITVEFEARSIGEAKQIALDLYDGSADVFGVFDENGERIFTEENYMWEAGSGKVNKDNVANIIENFIIYFTTIEKERNEMYDALKIYMEEGGEPF